jgi:hypothetical protein
MYCKVLNCNYSSFHTTRSHKCGKCQRYGHGVLECDYFLRVERLKQYFNDELPPEKYCTISDCRYKRFHSIESHQCIHCKGFKHSMYNCPIIVSPSISMSTSASILPASILPASTLVSPTSIPPPPPASIPLSISEPVSVPSLSSSSVPLLSLLSSASSVSASFPSTPASVLEARLYGYTNRITLDNTPMINNIPNTTITNISNSINPRNYKYKPPVLSRYKPPIKKKYNITCYMCKQSHKYDKTKIHVKADCSICMTNNIDLIFPCGHTCCEQCFDDPAFSKWVKFNY